MQAGSTRRACTYRGRSLWSLALEAEKSAEVIVVKVKPCFQYFTKWWRAKTEGTFMKDWILNVGRIIMPIQSLMLTRNGVSLRVMLIKKTTNFIWCKEHLKSCLGNRRVRDPYARWCERRTPFKGYFGRSRLLDSMLLSFLSFRFFEVQNL